jgi:hypothetical protein
MMTGSNSCRRILAAGAIYDLVVVAPLASPWTAPFHLEVLNFFNRLGGFSGSMPDFLPIDLLFINLFGIIVLVWAVARLKWPGRPLVLGDLAVRLSVSAVLGWYTMQGSVNGIVSLFFLIELGFVAIDWFALRSANETTPALAGH